MQHAATRPACTAAAFRAAPAPRRPRAQRTTTLVVRAEGPLREFREDTGEMKRSGGGQPGDQPGGGAQGSGAPGQPPRDGMSEEMKKRLRQEYVGFGGSPNKAMGGNYFLYIILIISFLAVLSKLTGAI